MDYARISVICNKIKTELEKHRLQFKFRDRAIVDNGMEFGEPNCYTDEYVELEAIKRGSQGACTYSRIFHNELLARNCVDEVVRRFCDQAVNALQNAEVE